ncbi:MAG: type II toxin-antitoxin system prevent-host-death family antitoxin [Acetobacteraceae bacterium]|nr:type II toxin-antitoxin system prevent-host-death family antitoxin [Acetobacteraceae bacterium]
MDTVSLRPAEDALAALIARVRGGEEVVITQDGVPVARLSPVPDRRPGAWRSDPSWAGLTFDPKVFAPVTDQERRQEGWPD